MAISASQVKALRDKTGAGMMDAKKALVETDGDMEAAVDLLRVKGLAKADKKSSRTAAEGLVAVAVDGGNGVVVEVNSETDFVARNPEFQVMVGAIATAALGVADFEALKGAALDGKTVAEVITAKIATIGENLSLRRMGSISADVVSSYIHNAAAPGMGKIGVLVGVNGGDAAAAAAIGKQVGMHVAAMSPIALSEATVDRAILDREKRVLVETAKEAGKSEAGVESWSNKQLAKFVKENTLLTQKFVIDPGKTVEKAVKEAGEGLSITGFVRFEVGEGIERNGGDDFASEVAKMAGG